MSISAERVPSVLGSLIVNDRDVVDVAVLASAAAGTPWSHVCSLVGSYPYLTPWPTAALPCRVNTVELLEMLGVGHDGCLRAVGSAAATLAASGVNVQVSHELSRLHYGRVAQLVHEGLGRVGDPALLAAVANCAPGFLPDGTLDAAVVSRALLEPGIGRSLDVMWALLRSSADCSASLEACAPFHVRYRNLSELSQMAIRHIVDVPSLLWPPSALHRPPAEIGTYLAGRLGDRLSVWEVFSDLVGGYVGTLKGLVDSTLAVTGTHGLPVQDDVARIAVPAFREPGSGALSAAEHAWRYLLRSAWVSDEELAAAWRWACRTSNPDVASMVASVTRPLPQWLWSSLEHVTSAWLRVMLLSRGDAPLGLWRADRRRSVIDSSHLADGFHLWRGRCQSVIDDVHAGDLSALDRARWLTASAPLALTGTELVFGELASVHAAIAVSEFHERDVYDALNWLVHQRRVEELMSVGASSRRLAAQVVELWPGLCGPLVDMFDGLAEQLVRGADGPSRVAFALIGCELVSDETFLDAPFGTVASMLDAPGVMRRLVVAAWWELGDDAGAWRRFHELVAGPAWPGSVRVVVERALQG